MVVPSLEVEMYGQYIGRGRGVSIVGRLSTIRSVHCRRFHCTRESLSVGLDDFKTDKY